jgi:antitoxin component YwqK of YwqJK toxin-antitoxin module
MRNERFFLWLAAGLLVLFQTFCKENPLETVETRDAEGRLERYQRRKTDFAKEGLYQKFAPDGKLLEEAHYLNDTLDGERKYFFPSGAVESIERYRRGQYHGKYQKFYENGQVFVEQDFVDGAMQNVSLRYYPNGVLQEKVTIRDNEENGPFWEYWENGKLKTEGTYMPVEEGESAEQGELKEYDENGQLVRIADCKNGICLTRWKK